MTSVLAVVGATASGKTALSLALAKKFNGEIISCDSMQIYRGMNIGTAKPSMEERGEYASFCLNPSIYEELFFRKSVRQYVYANSPVLLSRFSCTPKDISLYSQNILP